MHVQEKEVATLTQLLDACIAIEHNCNEIFKHALCHHQIFYGSNAAKSVNFVIQLQTFWHNVGEHKREAEDTEECRHR